MDEKKQTLPHKKDLIKALALSPAREEVLLYENGKAFDLSKKVKELGSQHITLLVVAR